MGRTTVSIVITILCFCLLIGAIVYFTGFDVGEMIVSGFRELKVALKGITGR